MAYPNSNEIGKFQDLISKNPLAFAGAVFFIMFWVTYFINIRKNDSIESDWRELYIQERDKNNVLTNELLIKNGVIKDYREVAKKVDSTLREKTLPEAENILNTEK